jgi:hypothetical protein
MSAHKAPEDEGELMITGMFSARGEEKTTDERKEGRTSSSN